MSDNLVYIGGGQMGHGGGKTYKLSESASTPCSDADLRRATILGAFARAKGYKVGDNPYSEDDNRHWKWMQGWAESGDLQL